MPRAPDRVLSLVGRAIGLIGDVPGSLQRGLDLAAQFEDEAAITQVELIDYITGAPVDDPVLLTIHQRLAYWDAQLDPTWGARTQQQTRNRRQRTYSLLEADAELRTIFDEHFPPHLTDEPEFAISTDFVRWFDRAVQEQAGFYWRHYRRLLLDVDGWPAASAESLARATGQVVERLAEPVRDDVLQSRGLVVGFVQSGKTANFTGVIARAVDAGYRLIIVLAGTTNLLRSQTQRRIDKQLVGRELLTGAAAAPEPEYEDAPDWERFITYGSEPSKLGSIDWLRLTDSTRDYRRLGGGIAALHFEHQVPGEPANSETNLAYMRVRLLVMKKNRAPLTSLAKDLRAVAKAGIPLHQIPSLIIDDESDQASVNTRRPTPQEVQRRTSINRAIADLLQLLPRAQYVGYTATPFANVFVDPNDELGIFPRNFILSLERPIGYMGASDYHDFGEERPGYHSNERAYVRAVYGGDDTAENLRRALDCYVLSGGIKLHRQGEGVDIDTRHHTMLVHTSHLTSEHNLMANRIEELLEQAGYFDGTARTRLATLLDSDFAPVSRSKTPTLPFPKSFAELEPHVAACLDRLNQGPQRVLIVNGVKENEKQSPDFDRDSVWKVIVGGTKLSRGYTVEGLTVSYYRRTSTAADTLMQMGRWFGFRRNYGDLMRLFIGRAEGSKSNPFDLYAAFEAICRDELDFRTELRQYALPEDGAEPVMPMQVPPLVTQHLPDLRPTAQNKMYNAFIQSQNFGGKQIARTLAPKAKDATLANQAAARALLSGVDLDTARLGATDGAFTGLVGCCDPATMVDFLDSYRWERPGIMDRALGFLRGELGDPEIQRWLLIWPMLATASDAFKTWTAGPHEITVIQRFRHDSGRFNVYTTSDHVTGAQMIAKHEQLDVATPDTARLAESNGTAVALMYAVKANPREEVTIGFAAFPPDNHIVDKTRWGVRVKDASDEPIVELPSGGSED